MSGDDPTDPPSPTDPAEREALLERAASAHREAHGAGFHPHAAWVDLDAEGRAEAFERARRDRWLEAGLDPEGLSSTARAVLAAIRRGGRRP